MKGIVLASASPRRRELLDMIGVAYESQPVAVDETPRPEEAPTDFVARMALEKARAGVAHCRGGAGGDPVVLGADTVVTIDGLILGKPADRADGLRMLELLSGREQTVYTAIAAIGGGREERRLAESVVRFRPIGRAEAEEYWETGEPHDKAGGWAIQGLGAVFVEEMTGSHSCVMGLPLYETGELLRELGIIEP